MLVSLFMILYFTYIFFDNLSSEVFGLKQLRKQNLFPIVLSKILRFRVESMIRHEQLFTMCDG